METLSETKMTLTFVFLVSLCTFVFLLTFVLLRKQYHGDCYGFRYALPVEKWNKLSIKVCQYQKILLNMYIALERVAT